MFFFSILKILIKRLVWTSSGIYSHKGDRWQITRSLCVRCQSHTHTHRRTYTQRTYTHTLPAHRSPRLRHAIRGVPVTWPVVAIPQFFAPACTIARAAPLTPPVCSTSSSSSSSSGWRCTGQRTAFECLLIAAKGGSRTAPTGSCHWSSGTSSTPPPVRPAQTTVTPRLQELPLTSPGRGLKHCPSPSHPTPP